MFKKVVLLLFVLSFHCVNAQIKLTHNIGTIPIHTDMFSCESDEGWSRVFKLSDFGVSPNEQFIIKSGQVAFSKSNGGALLQFNVFSIDETFPEFFYSLYPRTLLGARGIGQSPIINGPPEIIQVDFEEPIIVPAGVDRILVTVKKIEDFYNPESAEVLIAGTEKDTGISWYEGCEENYSLTPTTNLTRPVPKANFFINVTGEVFDTKTSGPTTRLSHNVCDDVIKTDIHSCKSSYIYWARAFTLEEFGISTSEEFIINSGQVGINNTGWLPEISFNIYKIDNNFPASFSETDLIGSSQYQQLSPNIGNNSEIIQVDFETPIVIPAGVERILVEVHKGIVSGDGVAFIAGSSQDNEESWQRGCVPGGPFDEYVSTAHFGKPDANFYINVTGKVNHITNNFQMNISNICSEFLKEFSVENKSDIVSVVWDFGDPASGINNNSKDLSPFHDFSVDGRYTITATVTAKDGNVQVLTETINVKEPPNAYGINNIESCENSFGTGISTTFDTSLIQSQVLGNQTDKIVIYIDGSGNKYNLLPNPFTNTIKDRETITVRVARNDELCCYSETTFDLIINPIPNISSIEDLYICDNDSDGFTFFNLNEIKSDILSSNANSFVDFFHEDGQQISSSQLNAVPNKIQNQETITARVTNTATNCYSETVFKIAVTPIPTATALTDLTGCDDNNDGISEYFDTSNIEALVLGNQTGMEVTYFDSNGNQLISPLPNPYRNTKSNKETICVRVTNPLTGCYSETLLNLITSSQPLINQPATLYACDNDNGIGYFNTSIIENQLIGNQSGLRILYYDENGNQLPSPLPLNYQNTNPWKQTILIRVENEINPICYSETNLELIINELPQINLKSNYTLCDLEPSLYVATNSNFDTWQWTSENGSVISNSFEANLINAGIYTLKVTKANNGISCVSSFSFSLARSVLPKIEEVKIQDISDNNHIEIITSGEGDFEYSIDGINFQDDNSFQNLSGGVYNVQVRDKNGCGLDIREVVLVDYPKVLTPNNDGYNDHWQIDGASKFPNSKIFIYDRYGKLLKELTSNSLGWDGSFNGNQMPPDDYWFIVNLSDGRTFKGHFSLIR